MKFNLAIRYKLVDVYLFNNSYLIYILYLFVMLNVFQLEYVTKAASFKLINHLSIYLSIYLTPRLNISKMQLYFRNMKYSQDCCHINTPTRQFLIMRSISFK